MLKAHSVTRLIHVRTVPRSRHNPQFNRDTFSDALESSGIHYMHVAGLGAYSSESCHPVHGKAVTPSGRSDAGSYFY
jgi:uncharacterized protein (DUF488 family)